MLFVTDVPMTVMKTLTLLHLPHKDGAGNTTTKHRENGKKECKHPWNLDNAAPWKGCDASHNANQVCAPRVDRAADETRFLAAARRTAGHIARTDLVMTKRLHAAPMRALHRQFCNQQ